VNSFLLCTYQLTFPHSPQDSLSAILISQLLQCEHIGQCRQRDSRHVASFKVTVLVFCVYFEIQNTMRWSEGDTVKFVSFLRIHFLIHNLRGRNCPSSTKLLISSVKHSDSRTRTFLSRTIFEREIRPRKELSCLRDDAAATGEETVLVCVDTYLPTCLGKSNARLVTLTSNWYTRVKKNPSA